VPLPKRPTGLRPVALFRLLPPGLQRPRPGCGPSRGTAGDPRLSGRFGFRLPLTLLLASAVGLSLPGSLPARMEPSTATAPGYRLRDGDGLINEGQRPDPLDFSAAELRELQRRFGVHGPQPTLAQLFTEGLDQLQPLRAHTLGRLEELRPVLLSESRRRRINPMLVAAVLFDEMQHAKPGEDTPLAAGSGLFKTHGPAQLGVEELMKQGLLPENASPQQITQARLQLLDPNRNVQVLVGKFARLSRTLGLSHQRLLMASGRPADAKALATLAYLHNGKLDYPGRILRYMQNPELHGLIYGSRRITTSPLI
jgi:hypothetical protein